MPTLSAARIQQIRSPGEVERELIADASTITGREWDAIRTPLRPLSYAPQQRPRFRSVSLKIADCRIGLPFAAI
jgi:hypothetical protein